MTDREALTYEQARDELASVVKRLETGGLTLEQSLDLWERGEKLAAICAEWLDGARARLHRHQLPDCRAAEPLFDQSHDFHQVDRRVIADIVDAPGRHARRRIGFVARPRGVMQR